MAHRTATLTVQKWGNSLAIRIPAAIARNAHFDLGTPVELTVQEDGITVIPTGPKKLTLKEMVALYDSSLHGGEEMASEPVGREKF